MIVKIITTDPTLTSWKSLKKKIKNIRKILLTMKNVGDVEIQIIERPDLKPAVVNERITLSFMEGLTKEYTKDGEAFIILHMSDSKRKELGIKPTLRGSSFDDKNFYSEAYFWADENTKRGRYVQFEETCIHEISHLIVNRLGGVDLTHEWDKEFGTVRKLFKQYDYRKYQQNLIDKITSWLKNQFGPSSLQPVVQRKADLVIKEMASLGHTVHVFEGFRSLARQKQLYAQLTDKIDNDKDGKIDESDEKVTNAKPGESLHNYGVAVDIVFGPKGKPSWNPNEPWKLLGATGKKYGFEWGGDWVGFNDLPHLEMRLGYTLQDFQNKKVDYNKFI